MLFLLFYSQIHLYYLHFSLSKLQLFHFTMLHCCRILLLRYVGLALDFHDYILDISQSVICTPDMIGWLITATFRQCDLSFIVSNVHQSEMGGMGQPHFKSQPPIQCGHVKNCMSCSVEQGFSPLWEK